MKNECIHGNNLNQFPERIVRNWGQNDGSNVVVLARRAGVLSPFLDGDGSRRASDQRLGNAAKQCRMMFLNECL